MISTKQVICKPRLTNLSLAIDENADKYSILIPRAYGSFNIVYIDKHRNGDWKKWSNPFLLIKPFRLPRGLAVHVVLCHQTPLFIEKDGYQ